MIAMVDGPMINKFVGNKEAFNKCAEERFKMLDKDGDGVLSRDDLPRGGLIGRWILAMDAEPQYSNDEDVKKSYDSIFRNLDSSGKDDNTMDCEKFRSMLMEIMLAMARGIGKTPVNVLVDDDSLLLRACE